MKILVVDDDAQLVSFVKMGLEDHGMQVTAAYEGVTGEHIASSGTFDVIVVDIMLPGITGFELVRRLRQHQVNTPVLMLTSLDSTEDKVTGFDQGADDYLSKPFDFPELVVRLKALHRRYHEAIPKPILRVADLEIDTVTKKVSRAGKPVSLTAREYKILELLATHENKVFERAEIAQEIWGYSFNTGTNLIDVHISALRRKMDKNFSPKLIHTVTGIGYALGLDAPS